MATMACICRLSPVQFVISCERMRVPLESRSAPVIAIDHRCPHHGEKAQPKLWGRHKELELTPTWAEWKSLGVMEDEGWKTMGEVVPPHSTPIQVFIDPDTNPLKWRWKALG